MFIKRFMAAHIKKFTKFLVIAILGPRQSGKITFAQHTFPKHTFISFEQEPVRQEAIHSPVKRHHSRATTEGGK